ncbi:MAG: C26 family cysteine hydrolase domain-containing family [Thaumarchaeota archaeon]|jgi:GMP synthase (glutamine-hydrolysing)|nr:C26 family cysteine hydrolase domain-containing family [Nitrososphaerota archaeon]
MSEHSLVYYIDNSDIDPDSVEAEKRYENMRREIQRVYTGPCVVRHYSRCSLKEVQKLEPLAVILSGSGTPWEQFVKNDWTGEFEIIREAEVPILGICGGHQVIGMAYWHPRRELGCSPIRRLKPGEKDENVGTHLEGYFVEKGFLPVRIVKKDPLFNRLGDIIYVDENHYCEVKELPHGFDLLASTDECRIQAMKHRMRPLYGVQFHPQIFNDEYPDGRRILENFFEIAQQYWENQQRHHYINF